MELFLEVGPENVVGIELNPYAAELARVTSQAAAATEFGAHGH